jgi:hypothetical protein
MSLRSIAVGAVCTPVKAGEAKDAAPSIAITAAD